MAEFLISDTEFSRIQERLRTALLEGRLMFDTDKLLMIGGKSIKEFTEGLEIEEPEFGIFHD